MYEFSIYSYTPPHVYRLLNQFVQLKLNVLYKAIETEIQVEVTLMHYIMVCQNIKFRVCKIHSPWGKSEVPCQSAFLKKYIQASFCGCIGCMYPLCTLSLGLTTVNTLNCTPAYKSYTPEEYMVQSRAMKWMGILVYLPLLFLLRGHVHKYTIFLMKLGLFCMSVIILLLLLGFLDLCTQAWLRLPISSVS